MSLTSTLYHLHHLHHCSLVVPHSRCIVIMISFRGDHWLTPFEHYSDHNSSQIILNQPSTCSEVAVHRSLLPAHSLLWKLALTLQCVAPMNPQQTSPAACLCFSSENTCRCCGGLFLKPGARSWEEQQRRINFAARIDTEQIDGRH